MKFVQDTSKYWYKPEISREQGECWVVLKGLGPSELTAGYCPPGLPRARDASRLILLGRR